MGCRRRFPADGGRLVRIVAGPEGSVVIGPTLPGRGAWLCGTEPTCLDRALRRKVLAKALRTEIEPAAGARLLDQLRSGFPAAAPDARD